MDTIYRYLAALHVSRAVAQYIVDCYGILGKTTGSPYITNPTPSLTLMKQHLDTLDAAQKAVFNGPKGAAAARNAALFVVRGDMRQLKACVQAAADADIVHGQAIIESTGLTAVRRAPRAKPDLAAKYGAVPGGVDLVARGFRGKGSYHWQMSTDQKTWTDLPPTTTAKTTVAGLTAGTLYFFRYRTLRKAGYSEWSTPVSIIAH